MTLQDTLVVLDTCVMLKMRLSDVLMDLRAEMLFSAHWTESIDDEFLRNLTKVHGIAAASRMAQMARMFGRL